MPRHQQTFYFITTQLIQFSYTLPTISPVETSHNTPSTSLTSLYTNPAYPGHFSSSSVELAPTRPPP